ncbi:DMT family transporter [uncultured Sphingomonas sp.]|uniref:DMT family transporter n=1 Tax=uncultured Sphingomonas sp. TaxID=158754 RepID=UPI0035CA8CCC
MTRAAVFLAGWTVLASAGIPLIGVLNGGMARSIGNPIGATAVMFAVACLAALGLALPLDGPPRLHALMAAPASSYAAGLLIGF